MFNIYVDYVLSYTQFGYTLLHCAAQGGITSLIERCINAEMSVNATSKVSPHCVLKKCFILIVLLCTINQ